MLRRRLSQISRSMSASPSSSHVLLKRVQNARIFLLNRPEKLNSLSLDMINILKPQLEAWHESDQCNVIMLMTATDKAFCAGGDVVSATSRHPRDALSFFENEYQLNHLIGTISTPFVSIMDGITMGGGVGLSVHAPFRIATEKTLFAMPETHIGLFPDVGGSFFLSRLDGYIGTYLGLTGHRLRGQQVFMAGVATHYIPKVRIESLVSRLSELDNATMDSVNDAIEEFSGDPLSTSDWDNWSLGGESREAIDRCFKFDTIEEIFEALEKEVLNYNLTLQNTEWSSRALENLKKGSPTSLKVTLMQLRKGAQKSFAECLKMEFRMVQAFLTGHDFREGVTALLVDKRQAIWKPNKLSDIKLEDIESVYFPKSIENHELELGSDTFYEYPHHTMSGLPRDSDVKRIIQGTAQRGHSYDCTSKRDVIEFCVKHWGKFDQKLIGSMNNERNIYINGGMGKNKIGLVEKIKSIMKRNVIYNDERIIWK